MSHLPTGMLDAVLDTQPVARLALRDLKDEPEALPIVFARAAGYLWSPLDGKPKGPAGQLGRVARLERAPGVMLLLDHYADDWRDLWWIRLRATTRVEVDKYPEWAEAIAALQSKYPQYTTTALFKDTPTMMRFEWRLAGWWAADGEAGIARWLEAAA